MRRLMAGYSNERVWMLALLCGLSFACSDAANGDAGAIDIDARAGASGRVSCADDPRVDRFVAHLDKSGLLGALTFEIVEADPAPPFKGDNRFVVRVSDTMGAPFTAGLEVTLHMPDHGHDSSVAPMVTLDRGNYTYTLSPLYFFMAGIWRVRLSAWSLAPASTIDQADFFFCVDG